MLRFRTLLSALTAAVLAITAASPVAAAPMLNLGAATGSQFKMISGKPLKLSLVATPDIPSPALQNIKFKISNPNGLTLTTDLTRAGAASDTDLNASVLTTDQVVKSVAAAGGYTSNSPELALSIPSTQNGSVSIVAWTDDNADDQIQPFEYISPQRTITFIKSADTQWSSEVVEPTIAGGVLVAKLKSTDGLNLAQLANFFTIGFARKSGSTYTGLGGSTTVSSAGAFSAGEAVSVDSSTGVMSASRTTSILASTTYVAQAIYSGAEIGPESFNSVAGSQSIVSGQVRRLDGTPVAGKSVSLNGKFKTFNASTTTDSNGQFQFTALAAGEFTVNANLGNSENVSATVVTDGSAALTQNLTVGTGGGHKLSGVLRSSRSPNPPVGNVNIRVNYRQELVAGEGIYSKQFSSTTNSLGAFEFLGVPEGTLTGYLSTTTAGLEYYLDYKSVYLNMGSSDTTQNLTVDPYPVGTANIGGTLKNVAGVAISGASVTVGCQDTGDNYFSRSTTTNNLGEFFFGNMPALSCNVSFQKTGYLYQSTDSFVTVNGGFSLQNATLIESGTSIFTGQIRSSVLGVNSLPIGLAGVPVHLEFRAGNTYWGGYAVTNSSGTFSILNVPASTQGSYKLSINPHGEVALDYYYSETITVTGPTAQGQTVAMNVALEPFANATAALTGVVKNRSNAAPISGAVVRINYGQSKPNGAYGDSWRTTQTNSSGQYSFANIYPGAYYSISVNKTGFSTWNSSFTMRSDETSRVRNVLLDASLATEGSSQITGNLVDENGAAIVGANVWLEDADEPRNATTDLAGKFVFYDLAPGTYSLNISKWHRSGIWTIQDFPTINQYVTVVGTSQVLNLGNLRAVRTVELASSVSGRIVDRATGLGVRTQIEISSDTAGLYDGAVYTNADGTWNFTGMPAGKYTVYYYLDNLTTKYEIVPSVTFEIVDTQPVQLATSYTRSFSSADGKITVTLRDKTTKNPIAGGYAVIWLRNTNVNIPNVITDAKGRAVFENLAYGDYSVSGWSNSSIPESVNTLVSISQSNKIAEKTVYADVIDATGTIAGSVVDADGNPVANATISASYNYAFGCCSGDGIGATATSDQNGYYVLERVPVGKNLDFYISADALDRTGLAPYQTKLTLPTSAKNRTGFDVTLYLAATVTGKVQSPLGIAGHEIAVSVRDAATAASRGSVQLTQDGTFTATEIAEGSVVLFVQDQTQNSNVEPFKFGYVKTVGGVSSIVADLADATRFQIVGGSTLQLSPINLTLGGTIQGNIKMMIDDEITSAFPRDFRVVLHRKSGSNWLSYEANPYIRVGASTGGHYSISGLPDGEYRLGYVDDWYGGDYLDPLFSGQKSTIGAATSYVIANANTVTAGQVILELKVPNITPVKVSLDNLSSQTRESLRDQVVAKKESGGVRVTVGKEYAGEWVSIGIDSARANASSLGRFSAAVLDANAASQMSNWVQVGQDGTVLIPASANIGTSQAIVVQDVNNAVIGWANISIATGGGSGSSGGGAAPVAPVAPVSPEPAPTKPSKPIAKPIIGSKIVQTKAGSISGTPRVGSTLKASSGVWSSSPKPTIRVQWLRCSKPVSAMSSTPASCKAISGATSTQYRVAASDRGKYVSVRISASNGANSTTKVLKSSQAVR